MAYKHPSWRTNTDDSRLMSAVAEHVTAAQALWFIKQSIRVCCPDRFVPEGCEWAFIDGSLTEHGTTLLGSRPMPLSTWGYLSALRMLRVRIVDCAADQAVNAARNTGWDNQADGDVVAARNKAAAYLRLVVKATFPEISNSELSKDVTDDPEFRWAVVGLFKGRATEGMFPDWLRDRGQDWAADHWIENVDGTGVVPWWLRDDVTGLSSQLYLRPAHAMRSALHKAAEDVGLPMPYSPL